MRADAAAFAIIQVCLKEAVFGLLNTAFRTVNITNTALDAFCIIPDRPLRPPASRMIFTGASRLGNNTADGKLSP